MKKRLMIFCSLISLLLVGFQFPIYAEEDPSDTPSSVPVPNSIRLDQYFFDNYDLLPYIESSGQQYINTGVIPSDNIRTNISFTFSSEPNSAYSSIFGSRISDGNNTYYVQLRRSQNYFLSFGSSTYTYNANFNPFIINSISFDQNNVYLNNSLIHGFPNSQFNTNIPIYIFAINTNNSASGSSNYRLFSFNIYDYDTESYVKYYYPAKSKSGGVIGLYDAVSDTFVTTSGSVPFASPIDDQVLNLQLASFLTAGLEWIGDILEFAVETPIIMIFMAIGLAGAMFRLGRRLVHF